MNLRQLQHFVALAGSDSARACAARLNLTQPALSKSIRALEDDLGVVLFERSPRGLRPTPVGEWLRDRSCALLGEIDRLRAEIAVIRRQSDGSVTMAAGTVLCAQLVPRTLARLRQVAPLVRVAVTAGYWHHQRALLLDGKIDFLVADAREMEDVAAFDHIALAPEPIGVFVRPGHPLAAISGLTLADLADHDAAGLSQLPRDLTRVLRDHPDLAARPADRVSSDDFALLRQVAAASDLLLFSPPSAVADLVAQRCLVALTVILPAALHTRFAIVWRRDRPLSPAARLVAATVETCAADAGETP